MQGQDDIDRLATFERRLCEAIVWCDGRASLIDPAQSLRTPALRPPFLLTTQPERTEPPAWMLTPRELLDPQIQAEREGIVEALSEARARLLYAAHKQPTVGSREVSALSHGRLLVCTAPDEGVDDWASHGESQGFFDVSDLPPWDTWVWYVNKHKRKHAGERVSFLLSWVPALFLPLVERGIRVNPVDCLEWATTYDSPFVRQLQERGLL